MQISVIVPAFNAAPYLRRTLAALSAQDYPPEEYEILLVDNASTDDTAAIAAGFSRVRLLHEPRRGSYAARNRALAEAGGQILAFADADRDIGRGWLRTIAAGMADPRVQILLGRSRPECEGWLIGALWDYENEKAEYVCQVGAARQQYAYTGNMAVRRLAWERYGPFVELERGGDVVFARRVVDNEARGAIVYCEAMMDRHQEMSGAWSYFRKMFIYGGSLYSYRSVVACEPLTMDDRIRIYLRCIHKRGHSGARALALGAGLVAGQCAYWLGSLRASKTASASEPDAPPPPVQPPSKDLSATVVVEWENVILAGDDRGRQALVRLARQAASRRNVDLVVAYNNHEYDGTALRSLLQEVMDREAPGVAWQLVAGPSADYYELKNAGAAAATGEMLVFSDSDTLVEQGWLDALLAPFGEPSVVSVCGSSYIETSTFAARAFACFWFFPPRTPQARVEPAKALFANNFAVRRDVFLQRPFVPVPGTSRGACVLWREQLVESGLTVVQNTAARTSHPPPNGMRHTLVRALTHGRDFVLLARHQGRRLESGAFGTVGRYALNLVRTTVNVIRRRHSVGLPAWQVLPALAAGIGYYTAYLAGEILTHLWPDWMCRRFKV